MKKLQNSDLIICDEVSMMSQYAHDVIVRKCREMTLVKIPLDGKNLFWEVTSGRRYYCLKGKRIDLPLNSMQNINVLQFLKFLTLKRNMWSIDVNNACQN